MSSAERLEDDFPYYSVSNALRIAYTAEAVHLYQRDSTFAQLRGGSVRTKPAPYWEGASAHDRAADAGKVVGMTRRLLSGDLLRTVEAYYLPADRSDIGCLFRKQSACAKLIPVARAAMRSPPPGAFIAAAIWAWAGMGELDTKKWAENLGYGVRTIQTWRSGRRGGSRGVDGALNDNLDLAHRELGQPMREYGLIP